MHWWREGTFYEIYVRSFQDSNGDGVGDLAGVSSRLEHLRWLGVDGIWLTPFYRSPMRDFGYDVSDHCDVAPEYGTLADFDRLLGAAHQLGIKVIVDFVPNHTSIEHPWFEEARASRESARRDWYLWADGSGDGAPPNDWRGQGERAVAGGGWAFDEASGQWYLANFSPSQPELNWNNPEVREAMLGVLDFWLERGVDGARVDMIDFLGKDPALGAESELPTETGARDYFISARRQFNRPETLDHIRAMREVADRHGDRALIGEMFYFMPVERYAQYQGAELLDLAMSFRLTFLPFEADAIAAWVEDYDAALGAAGVWPSHCVGNHDSPRIARHGEDGARLAAMLLLTLRGTPFLYYGDELGMPEVAVAAERQRDRLSVDPDNPRSRDGARTPMLWSEDANAGFCVAGVEPWLPLGADWRPQTVAAERRDPGSLLHLTRQLLTLRRETAALRTGGFAREPDAPAGCLAYRRDHPDGDVVVALNFGGEPAELGELAAGGRIVAATGGRRIGGPAGEALRLDSREGVVVDLSRTGQPPL